MTQKFLLFTSLLFIFFSSKTYSNELVVFIGDSHSVTTFGRTLDKNLRTLPNMDVKTYASCGAVGRYFWNGTNTHCGYFFRNKNGDIKRGVKGPTPKINEIFERKIPDYTIIQLSGNYTGYRDEFILSDMKKMAKFVTEKGSECLWVGPADSRNRTRIPRLNRLIEESVASYCKIFKSSEVTTYPETDGDGIHYSGVEGRREATNWANYVFDAFLN